MAEQATLKAQRRSITGSKVKQLRRAGIVPCNVYGRGIDSISIQAPLAELQRVFRSVDRNAVVQMQIDDDAVGALSVVLREIQRHPVSHELLHIDFYQVDLTRTIHSDARLILVGEAEGVALGGTVMQSLEYLPLEALPLEMPSEIEVDVTSLSVFGSSVLVRDVALPAGVRALADEAVAVATLLAPRLIEEDGDSVEGEEFEDGASAEDSAAAPAASSET